MKKKICIVQLENYHSEVIIPQLECLKDCFELHLYIPFCYQGKEGFSSYKYIEHGSFFSKDINTFVKSNQSAVIRNLLYLLNLWRLKRIVKKNGIELIIFNTVTNTSKAKAICSILKNIKKIRIVHNTEKDSSETRENFDLSVVLSKDLFSHSYQFDKTYYFEPCFFDSLMKKNSERTNLAFPIDHRKINIGIIGKTDYKRRNYAKLFDAIQNGQGGSTVCFYILGETSKTIIKDIEARGIGDQVFFKFGFFSFKELLSSVEAMDSIAYLIDPDVEDFFLYNRIKISGAANICKFFNKPVIIHEKYQLDESLQKNAIRYSTSINEILIKIEKGEIQKESITSCRKTDSEHQQYIEEEKRRFIETVSQIIEHGTAK